ncbi:MAG TPA: DUF4446 family protein [Candidatus Limnocylindrales bacterium]|nr:DUF4446 family protein [Candidatus Limnocylindrales bacterium]
MALAAIALLLLFAVLLLARRVSRLSRRLDGLTRGADGASLEQVVGAHFERVAAVIRDVERLGERTTALETDARLAFRHIGLVRFNPFEDTGGNQSFALALLDAEGDGFVVSSLHARAGTRIYAKALVRGRSEAALSDEETEAVRQAQASRTLTATGSRR